MYSGDLLDLMLDAVFCVIVESHWLDDSSTANTLKKLLEVSRRGKPKVLFTTSGRSACLREELSISETLELEMLYPRGADVGLDRHEFWTAT